MTLESESDFFLHDFQWGLELWGTPSLLKRSQMKFVTVQVVLTVPPDPAILQYHDLDWCSHMDLNTASFTNVGIHACERKILPAPVSSLIGSFFPP